MTFKTAAQIARLAANNNIHLQLASSNTFRSYIVSRQLAVQVCNCSIVGRCSAREMYLFVKKKAAEKQKFAEAGGESEQ